MSQDILAHAKLDVSEVFEGLDLQYSIADQGEKKQWVPFDVEKMRDMKMMKDTRPSYPSTKLTFTIANTTNIRWFNINLLNLNGRFDVDLILEDSQRNFLSSFI